MAGRTTSGAAGPTGRASPKGTLAYKRFGDRGAKWGLVSKPAVVTDGGSDDTGSCLGRGSPQTLQATRTGLLPLDAVPVALQDGAAASSPSSFKTQLLGDVREHPAVFAQDAHVGQPRPHDSCERQRPLPPERAGSCL